VQYTLKRFRDEFEAKCKASVHAVSA